MKLLKIMLVPLVLAGVALSFSYFVVNFTEYAVVTQLGKPVRIVKEPGLYFRIPFVQDVNLFDRRLQLFDGSPNEMLTKDKKNIVVDTYAKWKITDPLEFWTSVRDYRGAAQRLGDIVYAETRQEIGSYNLIDVINYKRMEIMQNITQAVDKKTESMGIVVIDLRVKRADLPSENEKAVFDRMRSEREKIAKRYRSEGQEEAQIIRAESDRLRQVMVADAYRQEQEIMGQGDAEAASIYAAALERDPEFYRFVRQLELYRKSLKDNSTLVLDDKSHFLESLMGSPE